MISRPPGFERVKGSEIYLSLRPRSGNPQASAYTRRAKSGEKGRKLVRNSQWLAGDMRIPTVCASFSKPDFYVGVGGAEVFSNRRDYPDPGAQQAGLTPPVGGTHEHTYIEQARDSRWQKSSGLKQPGAG